MIPEHPEYSQNVDNWLKWRRTYEGGDDFIDYYLKKYSSREDDADFQDRKDISYVPAFASAAVDEVKDAIFQRITDVTREGGSESYLEAVRNDVDLSGTTMNSFIGRVILPEMLVMKKVGVYIDMPELNGDTLLAQRGVRPYIYYYKAEDIINWDQDLKRETFTKLLLRDYVYIYDEETGLPQGIEERYRFIISGNGVVTVDFLDRDFNQIGEQKTLKLPRIPFVKFEISHSLLKNIANYQIALLNLASADIGYALQANYPFYVEQYDPRTDNLYGRTPSAGPDSVRIVNPGEKDDSVVAKAYEVTVGTVTGRRVPKGLEMPMYIHPSPEPLLASMKKQEELKRDIRMLVKLNVSNLSPKMASGESKSFDERSLEAGLSAIGLELEHGEKQIATFWQLYENSKQPPPTVKYPEKYSLQTDRDKRQEAKDLQESVKGHPSLTYKKEIYKLTSATLVGPNVSKETLDKINAEIEAAEVIVSNPEELNRDIELTLIDPETASKAKGYPDGVVAKANEAHAERVKRIAESQAKARGADDLGGLANASRNEKMDKDEEIVPGEKTRGPA